MVDSPGLAVRSVLGVVCLVLLAGCVGCGGRTDPNILLITLDTLRADHLGCYGYTRPTSPILDDLAAHATFYRRSLSSASWTVPTHASLFTGRHTFEHGADSVHIAAPDVDNVVPLSGERPTLAEALAARGYRTSAFVANDAYLGPRWGFARGFDEYVVDPVTAAQLNKKILAWLESRGRERFFLFLNYMDVHRPYNAAPRPGFLSPPAVHDQGQLVEQLHQAVMPGVGPLPQPLVNAVVDQYDTAIANLDEQIGVLFEALRRMGLFDDLLIVVTSDHGEYIGEHHLVGHSKDIYQEVLRVPLIVKLPGQKSGTTSDDVISSPDIPGLILAHVSGADDPVIRELSHYRPGNHPVIAENYYTRPRALFDPRWGHRFNRVRVAIFDGPYKLIHSSDGAHELYDLERDPGESTNLVVARREVAERLAAQLAGFRHEPRDAGEPRVLDPEERERLRSLGYLGH